MTAAELRAAELREKFLGHDPQAAAPICCHVDVRLVAAAMPISSGRE